MPASAYSASAASLLGEDLGLSWLRSARNSDGGWGYRPGAMSGVEPTCWVLLALLRKLPLSVPHSRHKGIEIDDWERTADWLRRLQLRDGSWPAFPQQTKGCWATALVCGVLYEDDTRQSRESVKRGVRWLCDNWPAEWGFWRRVQQYLRPGANANRQKSSLRGWSWTPGTASWVEPTAHVLLLLKDLCDDELPHSAQKRKRVAEQMLYDRMCPGGGWNAGNPMVYNVAGIPRVGPTAWALLALQDHRKRPEIKLSLDWLAGVFPHIQGPGSVALAYLAQKAHGIEVPSAEPQLRRTLATNECLMNVVVVAWVSMALQAHSIVAS